MDRARSLALVRYLVLVVAICLAVDTATPLLPGAFRVDPCESVEAGGRPNVPTIVVAVVTRSPEPVPAARHPAPSVLRTAAPPRLAPRFVPILHPPDLDPSSRGTDDD